VIRQTRAWRSTRRACWPPRVGAWPGSSAIGRGGCATVRGGAAVAVDRPDGRAAVWGGQHHRAAPERRGRRVGARVGARGTPPGPPRPRPRRTAAARRPSPPPRDDWRSGPIAPRGSPSRSVSWRARRSPALADPDARPIRKGKLGRPTEFGSVVQLAEVTEHTRSGARGPLLPASSRVGAGNESELLAATVAEIDRLKRRPRELAFEGGFEPPVTNRIVDGRAAVFIAGRQQPGSRRSAEDWPANRVGCEGRILRLKHRYGWPAAASKATTEPEPGSARRSSPTTSTPSPSAPPDIIPTGPNPATQPRPKRPRPPRRGRFTQPSSSGASSWRLGTSDHGQGKWRACPGHKGPGARVDSAPARV
jgi:hypothetical protein